LNRKDAKSGTVVIEEVRSRVLRGNPLQDPAVRKIPVYLPPSYYNNSTTRFPVIYCLAGFTSSGMSFFNFQAWVPTMDQRMDALIAKGMPEMILVFPDCFTRYGGSQYIDSPAVGNYRTFLTDELIPYIDRKYRTQGRGVMGKSSGGYGAITLAMERPNLFSAVACHSGDMYFEYCYLPEFPLAIRGLERAGGIQKYLKNFDSQSKNSREDHAVLNMVAMSACYSPNKKSPHGFDLPFDASTGEIRSSVWKRWKEKDPVEIIRRNVEPLRKLGSIYLDCGRRDEFFLHLGARLFVQELKKARIPHEYQEFEDGHFNVQHRYDVSLKMMAEYFNRKNTKEN
jgi:S-formylglutathione hydrolase FrmB